MHSTFKPIVVAGMLALVCARAAAAPPAGRWEGSVDGRKAVSLELRDAPALAGSIVFYILRDERNGEHAGEATPSVPLAHLTWDGQVLRFDVEVGDRTVAFEMRPAADGKAALKRLAGGKISELALSLSAIR